MRGYEPGQGAEELKPDQTIPEASRRLAAGDERERSLTLEELAQRGGVSARTVRFYIAQGLLTGPGSRGKAATYGGEHLLRLRLIRRLTDRHVPLSDVRDLLARLSSEEARELLAQEDRHAAELHQAARAPSPQEYVARLLGQARASRPVPPPPAKPMAPAEPLPALEAFAPARKQIRERGEHVSAPAPNAEEWRRYELAPGLELHVSSVTAERYRDLIERLLRMAGASDNRSGG